MTMISRGVEISSARGGEEMVRACLSLRPFFCFFFLFLFFVIMYSLFSGTKNCMQC